MRPRSTRIRAQTAFGRAICKIQDQAERLRPTEPAIPRSPAANVAPSRLRVAMANLYPLMFESERNYLSRETAGTAKAIIETRI